MSWLRPGRPLERRRRSRPNPVSITTWPCRLAVSARSSTVPGRTSVQRSGRGRPVTTVNWWSKARWTLANRSSSIPLAGQPSRRQQSGDLVEHAELPARPCRRKGRRRRGWSGPGFRGRPPATVATVVRPGAPAGPQTAITRPLLGAGSVGRRRRLGRGLVVGGEGLRELLEGVPADGVADADAAGTHPAGLVADDGDRPDAELPRWSTAARSNPGASIATTAVSAWPGPPWRAGRRRRRSA